FRRNSGSFHEQVRYEKSRNHHDNSCQISCNACADFAEHAPAGVPAQSTALCLRAGPNREPDEHHWNDQQLEPFPLQADQSEISTKQPKTEDKQNKVDCESFKVDRAVGGIRSISRSKPAFAPEENSCNEKTEAAKQQQQHGEAGKTQHDRGSNAAGFNRFARFCAWIHTIREG